MSKEAKGRTDLPTTSKEPAVPTLISLIRPAAPAPAFQVSSGRSLLRGLAVVCLSAIIAAGFVLDVAGGARSQPRDQVVQQAIYLT